MKKIFKYLLSFVLAFVFCIGQFALSAEGEEASDISKNLIITTNGFKSIAFLTDKKPNEFLESSDNPSIQIKSESEMASLYMIFGSVCGEYVITDADTGKALTVGKEGYLHEYIDLVSLFGKGLKNIVLNFKNGKVKLGEIYAFSLGRVPSFVEKWGRDVERQTDLVLFSAHADDDQLYFAGLLPYYTTYKGYKVQVVYMTDHHNTKGPRMNEALNGLWAAGVREYPVFGTFEDFRIDNVEKTYQKYEQKGVSREALQCFVVEQIRKFKPLVVVGHDFLGEYGHGMHRVYADLLSKAIYSAADETKFSESKTAYGVWQIKKAYFHLYDKNPITMDFDTKMDCFGGLSAFEVSQKKGFPSHVSQQWEEFKEWINGKNGEITKASQIEKYNPAKYGLFYTAVGLDRNKNDMFENIYPPKTEEPPVSSEVVSSEVVSSEEETSSEVEPIESEQETVSEVRNEETTSSQEEPPAQEASGSSANAIYISVVVILGALFSLGFAIKDFKDRFRQ